MYDTSMFHLASGVELYEIGWTEPNLVQITDPEVVAITDFTIDSRDSYTEVIQTDAAGTPTLQQVVRKFSISLEGQLVLDDDIHRQVVDVVSVRNDQLL